MEATAFAVVGAVISVVLGAFANWMTRPKWAERHPGRVVAVVAALAVSGALISVAAQHVTDDEAAGAVPGDSPSSASPLAAGPSSGSAPSAVTVVPDGGQSDYSPVDVPVRNPSAGGGSPVTVGEPPTTVPALRISSGALPVVEVGVAWTADLTASGGTPAYRWALSSGALPAGFVLQPGGQINGTARTTDPKTFTVVVTDRMGATATKEFRIEPRPTRSDLNKDGPVDCADKAILQSQWNRSGSGLSADLNRDEVVNITDLSIMMSDWTGDSGSC